MEIPEIKQHSFSNKLYTLRNKMPMEQDNSIIYFLSELETEMKNGNYILEQIMHVLACATGTFERQYCFSRTQKKAKLT